MRYFSARTKNAQKLIQRNKVSAFLITNPINITYLSGFTGSRGFLLITKSKAILFTDSRYIERAKYIVPKWMEVQDITKVWRNPATLKESWQKILRQLRIKSIGHEGDHLTVKQFEKYKKISRLKGKAVKFQDISGEISSLRAIKDKHEIALLRKSQQINIRTFELIKKFIQQQRRNKKSLREIDVAWEIKRKGFELGAENVSFDPIVAFGKNSSVPHHQSGTTRLKQNDIILIDMGMKYKGYCSDFTRTILPKKPTKLQNQIYKTVQTAQQNTLKNLKPGLLEQEIDSIARNIIEDAGFAENFGHGTGHGVGLEIHEYPSVNQEGTRAIKPGMVLTIEPGIYIPGKFGVRIEDIVVIKTSNNSFLF
jgi:Xaa-Pro aminopeptidase